MGLKCQNSIFLEHGHVAYQIKGNHGCSNMVENILAGNPLPPPLTLGVKRSKLIFYRILSYQIKKDYQIQKHGSKYSAYIPSPFPTRPWVWG